MKTITLLLFLLLGVYNTPRPPPPFTAIWTSPSSARISWTQPAGAHNTCLFRNATLIRCWTDAPPGLSVVTLGLWGPLDGAFRPAVGDVYALVQDGVTTRAGLRHSLWLPVVRESRPEVERLWLGMVGRG